MLIRGKNDLASKYPELLKDWHSTKNDSLEPQDVTYASNKRVWWKCHVCGYEWESKISNRTCNNRGCPICKRKSAKKKYIENIIEKTVVLGISILNLYRNGTMSEIMEKPHLTLRQGLIS